MWKNSISLTLYFPRTVQPTSYRWQPASGKALKVTAGNFGAAAKQLFTCVAYTKKGTCIVGAKDGSVYAFGDQTCKKVFPGVHQSVVRFISFIYSNNVFCVCLFSDLKHVVAMH